jgi:hypothetical protein
MPAEQRILIGGFFSPLYWKHQSDILSTCKLVSFDVCMSAYENVLAPGFKRHDHDNLKSSKHVIMASLHFFISDGIVETRTKCLFWV